MKRLIVLFSVLLIAGIGFFIFFTEGGLPVDKTDTSSKIFVISQGEGLNAIANRLSSEKLVRNKAVFYLVVKQLGYEKKIQAGDFRLSPSMDVYEIAKLLTHGTLDIWVTIIEGTRQEEIAQVMSQKIGIPETEFLKIAKEGYLYPDTYLIPRDASAGAVVDILSRNFENKYTDRLQQLARVKGLTDDEVITLASLVEREANNPTDQQEVASVLLKRLQNDWPLQVDASIQYAVGYQPDTKSWWKTHLLVDDLALDTPYNTYKNKGLPPTPVSNPGISAIEAVVNADPTTPYWFYISDTQGIMHYAKTNEEHDANVRKFLR